MLSQLAPAPVGQMTCVVDVGPSIVSFHAAIYGPVARGIEAAPGYDYIPPPFTPARNAVIMISSVIPDSYRNSIRCAH